MSKPPLSPAAQAVLSAFLNTPGEEPLAGWQYGRDLAAALRAVATEVVLDKYQYADRDAQLRRNILAIAAELEVEQ